MLHQNLVETSLKQSERDIPRMSARNGVTDGTKMTASERVGNMFILLCARKIGFAFARHFYYVVSDT